MKKSSITLPLLITLAVFVFTGCTDQPKQTHVHTLENVKETPSTCDTCGYKEHYKCLECGDLFLDALGTQPTNEADLIIPATGVHSLSAAEDHHAQVAATCSAEGSKEYWECSVCHKKFSDANGSHEITDLIIPATGVHSLSAAEDHHAQVAATCSAEGSKEYWECSVCHKKFSDANGSHEITDLVIPASHKLEYHPESPANEFYPGRKEYWTCTVCESIFRDEDGEDETELLALTIPATSGFVAINGGSVKGPLGSGFFAESKQYHIDNLYACDHEVTQAEFAQYCFSDGYPSESFGLGDDHPMYGVSYYDAIVYCNLRSEAEGWESVYYINNTPDVRLWRGVEVKDKKCRVTDSKCAEWDDVECRSTLGYRLPTGIEWEYIALGGDNGLPEQLYKYSGSDDISLVAWYGDNSDSQVHEVRTKIPNSLGIYDMSGNIAELCEPNSQMFCSMLGGFYKSKKDECQVLASSPVPLSGRNESVGFRVVRNKY